jgi:hypothetical protein
MEFITGLIIGALVFSLLWYVYYARGKKHRVKEQSVVLLEKIRHVAKLITVESNFSEIMHFVDTKNLLLNLLSSDKKAIVVVNSKVLIGFDLKKMRLQADPDHKTVHITFFPEPEVLSIDNDVEYYDVQNGLFNKFNSSDLTRLNQKAKEQIMEKIPESGVLSKAREKAMDTLLMMEEIARAFGWHFSYEGLPEHHLTTIQHGTQQLETGKLQKEKET